MKWASLVFAGVVLLAVVGIFRGMLPPPEVRVMLRELSHPLAKDIGELCYMEGCSADENWYRGLEERNGPAAMQEALLALAGVPNRQIAFGAISILARKGDGRAVAALSKIAEDDRNPAKEQARLALEKIRGRGIPTNGQASQGGKGAETKRPPD